MKDRPSVLDRIYRLKLVVVGLLLAFLGAFTSLLEQWVSDNGAPQLLSALLSGLSDVLLVAGAIGIAVDFFTGRDKEAADTERLRSVLKEAAPDIRDAVIAGFAETPDTMRGVATDETLDKVATNALALRLGDDQFAREIYADVRDQAIRAPERWYDVDVSVRLSSVGETEASGLALFDVLVKWELTVVPSHTSRKFAVTSDAEEFRDYVSEVPSTLAWYMPPETGLDASSRENFELLEFRIDGALTALIEFPHLGPLPFMRNGPSSMLVVSDHTPARGRPYLHAFRGGRRGHSRVTPPGHDDHRDRSPHQP